MDLQIDYGNDLIKMNRKNINVNPKNMLSGYPLPASSPEGECQGTSSRIYTVNTGLNIAANPVFVDNFGLAFIVARAVECPFRRECSAASNCKDPVILARPHHALMMAMDESTSLFGQMVTSLYQNSSDGTIVELRRREEDLSLAGSLTSNELDGLIDLSRPDTILTVPDEWVKEFGSSE